MLSFTTQELAIVAQQQYALMKTKGMFMKSQAMEHEIVAMRAQLEQLKGKFALSNNVKQVGTEKPERDTNKQYHKQNEAWKKVPPKAGKPLTKKIKNKDFHWCKHCMAWTMHLPTDCRLKDRAKPSNTASPPLTNVTPAATTFSAERAL